MMRASKMVRDKRTHTVKIMKKIGIYEKQKNISAKEFASSENGKDIFCRTI